MASALDANASSHACYQGQTHGHEGFLLNPEQAEELINQDSGIEAYIHPYLITDDLIGTKDGLPTRYVIDFDDLELLDIQKFKTASQLIRKRVLDDRIAAAAKEKKQNEEAIVDDKNAKIAKDHANALKTWWLLFRRRSELLAEIAKHERYIACGRVTKCPIFAFVSAQIRPNDSLAAFPLDDDYSFGRSAVLNSLAFVR